MISFSFKNLKFTQIIRKLEDLANFLKHILVDNIFYLAFPFLIFTATYCSNPFEYKLYSSSYFLLSSYRKSFCLKRLPESFPYHKNLKKNHFTVYNFVAVATWEDLFDVCGVWSNSLFPLLHLKMIIFSGLKKCQWI